MMLKIQSDITGINDILKYIKIENSYHKLWAIWKSWHNKHRNSDQLRNINNQFWQ